MNPELFVTAGIKPPKMFLARAVAGNIDANFLKVLLIESLSWLPEEYISRTTLQLLYLRISKLLYKKHVSQSCFTRSTSGCGGLSWIETYCGIFTYPPDLKAYSSLVSRSNPDNGKMVSSRILLSQAYHLHLNINFHNPFVITFAFVAALGCREVVELGNPLGRGMYLIEF
ncbi:uncharacterized protein [Euphorbia lathyris]|uniref:uncharacterized protein n=1 Tax=Euphorbia lathyris TaxID=212925 RepID=UPI0033135745